MRILFLGTPRFAVPSLALLSDNGYEICGVVTAPDKPAGRGKKIQFSEVKKYALNKGFSILQPVNLKDLNFLAEIKKMNIDLGVVVAFRMMPEQLWSMPVHGTINLHGSLLPQYRGAAPIQRAVMNGEKRTGVTTFFLKQTVDTGNIIFRQEIAIGPNETSGEMHDRMMHIGAQLLLKTVQSIEKQEYHVSEQNSYVIPGEVLMPAHKIFKSDCRLNFNGHAEMLFNQVRGLSPHPSAFFETKNKINGELVTIKVLRAAFEVTVVKAPGMIITDNKTYLKISAADGLLSILELQWPGKRAMHVDEFLRGFLFNDDWSIV